MSRRIKLRKPSSSLKMPAGPVGLQPVMLLNGEESGEKDVMIATTCESGTVVLGGDRIEGDPLNRSGMGRPVGKRIKFEDLHVEKTIGKGAFGVVKKVRHKDNAVYVLKEIIGNQDKKTLSRELLPLLTSDPPECAIKIYDAYVSQGTGTVKILMEYMDYGSVLACYEELQAKEVSMKQTDLAVIAHSSLRGLQALRERHIVHRDIKPANILIGKDGVVKIGDFGISSFTDLNSVALSRSGSVIWMAPERIMNRGHSYPADVFSLGLVVHFLETGHLPSHQVMALGLFEEVDVSTLTDKGKCSLKDFIQAATMKNPSQRPCAKELLDHSFFDDVASSTLSFLPHLEAHGEACKRPHQPDPATGVSPPVKIVLKRS